MGQRRGGGGGRGGCPLTLLGLAEALSSPCRRQMASANRPGERAVKTKSGMRGIAGLRALNIRLEIPTLRASGGSPR